MKKKLLSLLLALAMVLSMLPAVSAAEVVAYGQDWNVDWVLTDDGTLTIYGEYMWDGQPNFVPNWSEAAELIRRIVLADGNRRVENWAFTELPNLEEVYLPETLEFIGTSALGGCPKLKTVHIPAGVERINPAALAGCAAMTHISVAEDNGFFSTVDGALTNKEQTELIQVPGGASGTYTVPESVAQIRASAFMQCHKLTEVVFPDHLTELPSGILRDLKGLRSVKLPGSLTAIPHAAFYGSDALACVEIPSAVTSIADSAFDCCAGLTNVVFRGDAPSFDWQVFLNDTLTAWYPEGNETWTERVMQSYGGNVTWKAYTPSVFSDVLPFQYWYESTAWAVENGITNGISATEFGPNAACNRAQVVTFLWRAADCPEPVSAGNPFVDVESGSFYEKAVLWAVEKGITNGTDKTHFSPNAACNRAAVVTFLHRAAGSPAAQNSENPFTDVPADSWYAAPIAWAVEQGITNGMGDGTFGVDATCNRAQVVTFLYRTYVN